MEGYIITIIIPVVIAILTSSGFWVLLEKRAQRTSLQSKLLIGLAHDRITYLGLKYIKRGSITHDEYENLTVYLYSVYHELGGNGSADRIMAEVDKLPIKSNLIYNEKEKNNV